jgi:hypothetical protein
MKSLTSSKRSAMAGFPLAIIPLLHVCRKRRDGPETFRIVIGSTITPIRRVSWARPMPLPAFLSSANLILCERYLLEKDEVLSAIRLVEVFVVPPPPPGIADWKEGDPVPPGATTVRAFVIGHIKATPRYTGNHRMSVRIFNSRNEWVNMPDQTATFTSRFPEAPSVVGLIAELQLVVRNYGTTYVCLFLDDQEVARTSLTTAPPPSPEA